MSGVGQPVGYVIVEPASPADIAAGRPLAHINDNIHATRAAADAELAANSDDPWAANDTIVELHRDPVGERIAAALAIHRPCHTAPDGIDCTRGHSLWDGDIHPALCDYCTYDNRVLAWPCATARALGATA